ERKGRHISGDGRAPVESLWQHAGFLAPRSAEFRLGSSGEESIPDPGTAGSRWVVSRRRGRRVHALTSGLACQHVPETLWLPLILPCRGKLPSAFPILAARSASRCLPRPESPPAAAGSSQAG